MYTGMFECDIWWCCECLWCSEMATYGKRATRDHHLSHSDIPATAGPSLIRTAAARTLSQRETTRGMEGCDMTLRLEGEMTRSLAMVMASSEGCVMRECCVTWDLVLSYRSSRWSHWTDWLTDWLLSPPASTSSTSLTRRSNQQIRERGESNTRGATLFRDYFIKMYSIVSAYIALF